MEPLASFTDMQVPRGGEVCFVPKGEVKMFLSVVDELHIKAERTALKALAKPGDLVGVKLGEDRLFFEYFTKDDFKRIQKAFKKAHGHAVRKNLVVESQPAHTEPKTVEPLSKRFKAGAARAGESISQAFSDAFKSLKNFFEEVVSVFTSNTSKHAEIVLKRIAKPEQAANFKKLGEIFKIAQEETDATNKLIKSGSASYQKVLWEKAHDAEQKFLNNARQIAAEAMEHRTDLLLTPEDRQQLNDLIGQFKTLRQSLENRMKRATSPSEIMEMRYKLVVVDDRIDQATHFEERNNAYLRIMQASTMQELRKAAAFLPNSKLLIDKLNAQEFKPVVKQGELRSVQQAIGEFEEQTDFPERSEPLINRAFNQYLDLQNELQKVQQTIGEFEEQMDIPERSETLKKSDSAAIAELKKMERELIDQSCAAMRPVAQGVKDKAIVHHRTNLPHIRESARLMLSQELAADKLIESSEKTMSPITKDQLHLEMREKVYFGVPEFLEGTARSDFETDQKKFNNEYTPTDLDSKQLELLRKPRDVEKHPRFKDMLEGAQGVSPGFRLGEVPKKEPGDFEATAKQRADKLKELSEGLRTFGKAHYATDKKLESLKIIEEEWINTNKRLAVVDKYTGAISIVEGYGYPIKKSPQPSEFIDFCKENSKKTAKVNPEKTFEMDFTCYLFAKNLLSGKETAPLTDKQRTFVEKEVVRLEMRLLGGPSHLEMLWQRIGDLKTQLSNAVHQQGAEAAMQRGNLVLTPENNSLRKETLDLMKVLKTSLENRMKETKDPGEILEMKRKLTVVHGEIYYWETLEKRTDRHLAIDRASSVEELQKAASFLPNGGEIIKQAVDKLGSEFQSQINDLHKELAKVHKAIKRLQDHSDTPGLNPRFKQEDLETIAELRKQETEILNQIKTVMAPVAGILHGETRVHQLAGQPHVKEQARLILSEELAIAKMAAQSKETLNPISEEDLIKLKDEGIDMPELEALQLEFLNKPKELEKNPRFNELVQIAQAQYRSGKEVQEPIDDIFSVLSTAPRISRKDFDAAAKQRDDVRYNRFPNFLRWAIGGILPALKKRVEEVEGQGKLVHDKKSGFALAKKGLEPTVEEYIEARKAASMGPANPDRPYVETRDFDVACYAYVSHKLGEPNARLSQQQVEFLEKEFERLEGDIDLSLKYQDIIFALESLSTDFGHIFLIKDKNRRSDFRSKWMRRFNETVDGIKSLNWSPIPKDVLSKLSAINKRRNGHIGSFGVDTEEKLRAILGDQENNKI